MNRAWAAQRAAACTRARLGLKVPRLCVRPWLTSNEFPPGSPLPSARLVSFGDFIGTMGESDARPQLERGLRQCLVLAPRRGPMRRPRSGLSCSDDCLSCVIWPSTPAKRPPLAYRGGTCCLRSQGTGSAFAIFHLSKLVPTPRTTPVYASDPALRRRLQDSVPTCPLRLWSGETLTHQRSSALHDALPGRGVRRKVGIGA